MWTVDSEQARCDHDFMWCLIKIKWVKKEEEEEKEKCKLAKSPTKHVYM